MYMNVIRTVICTLIILPVGLQAATSHSSMVKDTITIVATGNQNTVFETPSMVSVVTNDTPWSQNAGKRLTRTVLIFTESSEQLSRATDRVPGLPASPGYVQ